jgi:hypothetical protein
VIPAGKCSRKLEFTVRRQGVNFYSRFRTRNRDVVFISIRVRDALEEKLLGWIRLEQRSFDPASLGPQILEGKYAFHGILSPRQRCEIGYADRRISNEAGSRPSFFFF